MTSDYDNFLKSIEERIQKLKQIRSFKDMPMEQRQTLFPIVSDQERQIAKDAYIAFAEKYSISLEDSDAICQALHIAWCCGYSHTIGQKELASEEVAAKVKWQ